MSLVFASCAPKEDKEAKEKAAMLEKNKMATQKLMDAFATGNMDSVSNYIENTYTEHSPNPPGITSTGIQGMKDASNFYRSAFPDMKMSSISLLAEGDLVVAHFNVKATNSGPMGTMPATNKSIDVSGVDIYKFANGKAVEHWGYFEESKMMTQLGMMGEQKAPESKK